MAAIENDRLRKLKADVTKRLRAVARNLGRYGLGDVDARLYQYVAHVAGHPKAHNVWEQLGVEHFLYMCRKYGINVEYVKAFFAFYEQLTFPGTAGPTRYKLTPVQCFQFASVYGFWRNGRRVVRTACLFVPRKFSKTTSSAAFAVWDLFFGDANAEVYMAANSKDQAQKGFDVIRGCVLALDPGEKRFIVNAQEIKSVMEGRNCRAQCLTANAKTKDGLNSSTNIMDEYSQARDASLLNVLTTSMGIRQNPLTVIITTASDVYNGPFYPMLESYKRILAGDFEDDSVFAHLFEPDVGDDESDPATWHKVHPHLGVTVTEEFYQGEWVKAQREGAEAMLAFRTKLLNLYSSPTWQNWLTREQIEAAMIPYNPADTIGDEWVSMGGVDLSEVDDFSACTVSYYNLETARVIYVTDYFFPEGALAGHPNEELYRKWVSEGWLHLTEGAVVNYRAIADHLIESARRVTLLCIGYDSRSATDFANNLRAMGFGNILFPVPQSYAYFSDPVFFLEKSIKEGTAKLNDNPINLYCFTNCVLGRNGDGCKPEKKSHNLKIDGAISTLMAARQWLFWKR